MRLTTRAQYSLRAMLDLSLHAQREPVSVRTMAARQQLPAPYLEKLLMALRRAELVESVRGVQGGYRLARPAETIWVGQILAAVGETLSLPRRGGDPLADWVSASLWKRLEARLQDALFAISLADLYYDARSRAAAQDLQGQFVV